MRTLTSAAFLLTVLSIPLVAQPFATTAPRDTASVGFVDLLRASEEWMLGRDLARERSWKWYRRWEAAVEQRLNPGARRVDAGAYVDASERIASHRRALRRPLAAAGWFPVGPIGPLGLNLTGLNPGLGRINCVAFHPTDSMILWAGVAQGGLWKSADGGGTWRPLTDELPILRISDIAVDPDDTDVIYISVGDFGYVGVDLVHTDRKRHTHYGLGVYKTTDGGESWRPTGLTFDLDGGDASLIRRVFVHPANSAQLLAAGTGGTWRSSDAGATWTRGRSDFIWDIERNPGNPDRIVASTGHLALWGIGNASLIASDDFGSTWDTLATQIPPRDVQRAEIAFAPSDPRTIYVVCAGLDQRFHSFHRSTDGGANWTRVIDRTQGRNILGGSDGGPNDRAGQGAYDLAIIVDPLDERRVFVGGVNIWGSTDAGATWDGVSHWTTEAPGSIHADQHQFAYNPLNGRTYVCNDGGLFSTGRMEIGGWGLTGPEAWNTVWEVHSGGMAITSFYRVGTSRNNSGYVIAGSQDNSTFYYDRENWTQIFGGDGMDCFIDPDVPTQIYGSAQFGFLMGSPDGGSSAYRVAAEASDAGEAGEWTTPFMVHPTAPGIRLAGFGNVWRTDGNDTLWRRISRFGTRSGAPYPTPITALAVAPSDTSRIYAAKRIWHSRGIPTQLMATSDGGGTWYDATDGLPDSLYLTSLAVHPLRSETVWATFSGFVDGQKVYVTADGGATWSNVSRDLPNIPVNVVVHDETSSDNTLYAGTDIGVWTTSDRAAGWTPLGENLPNVIVSDLDLHAKSRRLYAATFGRGIWAADLQPLGVTAESAASAAISVRVLGGDEPIVEITAEQAARDATLEIIDILGRVVHTRSLDLAARAQRVAIGVQLGDGVYFARVAAGASASVARFVIER